MFDIQREELTLGGRKLVLETGRVARQADGAVWASWGETTVLATVVAAQGAQARPGLLPPDRPLPGEDLRRRAHSRRLSQARRPHVRPRDADLAPDRPADPAAVPRRLPLRHAGHRHRASATTWRTTPTFSALIAASAALTLSGVPFMGPIGGARVGVIKGEIKVNPTIEEMKEFDARSRRRRHRRRRADGRVGGQGALRGDDAEGGDGRPRRVPAGDPGDHPPRREGGQGAARPRRRRQVGGREGGAGGRRGRPARRLFDHPEAGALRRGRRGQGEGHGRAAAGGRRRRSSPPKRSPRRSTTPRPRWCAGTSSTTSAASTAAT